MLETVLIAAGVPSAIFGAVISLCIWRLQKKLEKRDKERDEKDEARRQNEAMLIEGVNAAIALGEATARAVQRIPDAKCNGDMHEALAYASSVKHKHKEFITKQGISSLY